MGKALSNLDQREKRVVETLRNLGGEASRREISVAARIPRTIVSEVVGSLIDRGVLTDGAIEPSSGGRPARKIKFSDSTGHLAAIVIGAYRTHVAIGNLDANMIAKTQFEMDVNLGPTKVLNKALQMLTQLQDESGDCGPLLGVVIGLPAPVEAETGFAVSAPLMGSWEGFDTKNYVAKTLGTTTIVENDVNLMAIGEHHWSFPQCSVLLAIKVSTGFGSGLVIHGTLIRGATGVAGDIGHMPATSPIANVCRCGRTGCAEAVGGGWAMVDAYNETVTSPKNKIKSIFEFVALCKDKDREALRIAREGAQAIGSALADAVSLINPDTVVINGLIIEAGDFVLSTIREMVYQRSAPLATRDLRLVTSSLDDKAGVFGALLMGSNLIIGTPIEKDNMKLLQLVSS